MSDDDVFAAVAATVADLGPDGLTLTAVATRAGVTAPALTQRFGSKRRMLIAFAEREVSGVSAMFGSARVRHDDPLKVITVALSSWASGIKDRETLANHLAFLQLDLVDPELRKHAVAQSRALRTEIRSSLNDAVEQGRLRPTTSIEDLAADLYAAYSGALMTWAIDGTGTLPTWLSRHLDRIMAPHASG